jgi:hypothetical protein
VTPLRLIGTQRTQYTHRKNRESKKVQAEIQHVKGRLAREKEEG